ncbi:MAG: zinc ribbon domain-containing protein [Myxococcales bacterium]
MSVKEKLKSLDALQSLDIEIMELQKAGEVHPKRLAELDAELNKARAAADAQRSRLAENERLRSQKQQEIQDEKDKVKKWESRLAEMRTTREYAALAREIDIAKKSNLNMEDELKLLVAQAEEIKRELAAREADLRQREDASAAERKSLTEKIGSLQGKVDELNAGRVELASKVEKPLLARYETIRKRRGTALAKVEGGVCRGCQMRLPPQLYHTLLTGTVIEQCPSCQRLVYVPQAGE